MVTETKIQNASLSDEEAEQLKKNISFFCSTPKGSLPQMRGYGIDFSVIGEGYEMAKRKLTVDIVSGVRDTFGVHISDIKVIADENGNYSAIITI